MVEEVGWEVGVVVVEGVLEVALLVVELVVLVGTEVLPDDDGEVVTGLGEVETVDEVVVAGTGVGVGVVLVGEEGEGDSEVPPTGEVVEATGGDADVVIGRDMVVLKG